MRFEYKARDEKGLVKTGIVVAPDQNRAEALLEDNQLVLISLEQQQENFFAKYNPFGKSVSSKDLVLFSRQLATLISARVPIIQALRILENQVNNAYLLAIVKDLIAGVENGETLSLSMSKHDKVFSDVYISLVKSGEASGSLDKTLVYLADQLEKDYELVSKVKSAMTYPAFVLVALVVVMILMFKFILPKLTSVLEEQGGDLPYITQVLISFTHFFDKFWWLVILAFGGLILGIRFFAESAFGKYQLDALKIRVPVIGPIFMKVYLSRFSRNLSTLIRGGIPIIKAMQIIADIVSNVIYRDILLDTVNKISSGKAISDGLAEHPREFPNIVTQMVKVGEQTAQLDEILGKLAIFYEKEVDTQISTLTSLLEPIIMVVLGAGVGILVAGILLPIYNMASTVS